MSDDTSETNENALAETLEGIGEGLTQGGEQIPEEQGDARTATETAGDVAQAAADLARAAEAGRDLDEAIRAGDEGRVASSLGHVVGGLAGTAGALTDGVAGLVPEEARGALNTVAAVARGVAGAARATERVVSSVQQVMAAIEGRRVVFQTGANLGEGRLVAAHAHGTQQLSGLYEFTVRVEYDEEGGLDEEALDGILTHPARLGLTRGTDGSIYGVVRRIEMHAVSAPRPTHYDLTLVPKLWRLSLVKRSRVFQDKSHLEAVKEVLRHHGYDEGTHFSDHTEESYSTHEYTVQYRETDLDFVRRLLAHNGIHFHFVQDQGTEVLVLGDRNAAFEPVEAADELVYHPHEFSPDDNVPRVWDLRRARQPRARSVVMRDYNWRVPHHPLRAEETVDEATGYGFVDLYGEHFRDDAQGRRLAQIRAEELRVEREVFTAKTSLRGVQPGSCFDLTNHPHEELNQRYLVIEASERMDDGRTYVNELRAIPYSVTYRPPRTIPWPCVEGVANAIVDGEQRSTATPIDEEGRYRVVLPADEATRSGGRASRWVRRTQPSAGAGYGMHLPLHIGTEVALAHVNGDPDRPIIVGAVPNGATQSPVVAGNAPQSRIRTGSGIVIELDDDC